MFKPKNSSVRGLGFGNLLQQRNLNKKNINGVEPEGERLREEEGLRRAVELGVSTFPIRTKTL